MTSSTILLLTLTVFGVFCVAALAYAAALSRHQKAARSQLDLLGAVAQVETALEPEGSVLFRGELWRATTTTTARGGASVERGRRVRITGTSGHLLEVEPIT